VTSDFVTINGIRYAITDRQLVSYPCAETPAERKARGDGPVPIVAYTSARIERVRDDD
jgi:hypothetical protein